MARGAWLRFCSDACQLKAQTARQKEQRQAKREVRRCEYCAEEFEPTRADAKTCSIACRVALHRLKRAGSITKTAELGSVRMEVHSTSPSAPSFAA
jgi:hypothetical protein